MDKATADSLISVQSFAIIKNTGHGNFVIGRFQTSEPSLCTVAPSPTDTPKGHPFSDFFLRGGGGCTQAI